MIKRLKRGILFFKQSFDILKNNKSLLFVSMASGITYLIILGIALYPLHHYEHLLLPLTKAKIHHLIWLYVVLAVFIFFTHVTTSFYSMIIVSCTMDYFNNQTVKLRNGFRVAKQSFWRMFFWVLYASTVGIFIYLFQGFLKKFKFMQKFHLKSNWNVSTHLILPILIVEKLRPLKALKRSSDLIYQNWGASVRQNYSFGGYLFLIRLVTFSPLIIGIYFGGATNIIIGALITGALNMIISAVTMNTNFILISAVYLYASEKKIPRNFSVELKNTYIYWKQD